MSNEKLKKYLEQYVELLNSFEIAQMNQQNINFTNEQLIIINEINKEAKTNQELLSLLNNVKKLPLDNRMSYINSQLNNEQETIDNNELNLIQSIDDYKKEEQNNYEEKPKTHIYKNQSKKAGYADVLLLSLITGFLGGVLTTLATLLLTK